MLPRNDMPASDLGSFTYVPKRICDVTRPWVERLPNHPALVESSGTWTYAELEAAVETTAAWLREAGVRSGDRVVIVCENCRPFVAVLFAVAKIDAWPALVNARLSPEEVDRIREHCGARRVIYTVSASVHAMQHANRHGAAIERLGDLGRIGIGALNDMAKPEPLESDIANNVGAMIYTSGTTSGPKGVMLTHRNLLHVAKYSSQVRSVTPDDRALGILPMSHAVGLAGVLLGNLLYGATLFLFPRFDPVTVLRTLENDQITIVMGAPGMFALLVEYAKLKGAESFRFPALRLISSSGAPLEAAVKFETEKLLGIILHNGYGVTECSPTIALTRLESPRTDTSVGAAFPGVEIRLVDENSNQVPAGSVGELQVRGPNVMKGYYRAPEDTAAAIDAEGWFNTRDLARLEGDHLFIVGRTKELIVRFGFKIYPPEVEAVLNGHPAVARSAVIGHAGAGEEQELIAFIQPAVGASVNAKDIVHYAAQNLTRYKQPTRVIVLSELPLTPTGKVAKEQLSKMLARDVPAVTREKDS